MKALTDKIKTIIIGLVPWIARLVADHNAARVETDPDEVDLDEADDYDFGTGSWDCLDPDTVDLAADDGVDWGTGSWDSLADADDPDTVVLDEDDYDWTSECPKRAKAKALLARRIDNMREAA